MRLVKTIVPLVLLACLSSPTFAQDEVKPDTIAGKMSTKFVRGVTNMATSFVELPKQTYLTVCSDGAVGYIIGPLKGIGMTLYRVFTGAVETAFFPVPQPGYYDPMIDPPYVWQGWEPKVSHAPNLGENPQGAPSREQSSEDQKDQS